MKKLAVSLKMKMNAKQLLTMALLAMSLTMNAANEKQTVAQVTTSVTVSNDVDYIVNGEEPFGEEGMVDLLNTEHAVLIIERLKPSKVIGALLASHVRINGAKAQNGVNCQVRLYGTRGSMILPYAKDMKPLTVYTGQNFTGESANNFGLENDGGYMVTMTDKQLNNRIRSFRLKRGYMVTFATQKSGYGYQRCFIANDQDVEMSTLPQILDEKITSYRIFKWNTAGKKGLASSTNATACDELNVISCYDWTEGHEMGPDVECVANHLYEDYPSSATCGKATWTCHMKTNNEPRNSSDDKPQTLETILGNWQNLMRTGMRLCSPSSWDGSDYTDGSGFLNSFFQAIDARGWRCDIADIHCYWLTDNFKNIGTMQAKYKRPIWVSEWIWGASWNKNGIFENGKDAWDNEWAVKTICNMLNSYGYVERYFYWNSEGKAASKIYDNGLTVSGKWYASQLTGMGYNSKYEKIPNTPPMQGGFTNFHVETAKTKATITWHDYDGEYNQLMELLRKEPDGAWQTWKTIRPEDAEADYEVVDDTYQDGYRYRLHIKSFSGRDYYSSEDMEPGEAIELDGGTLRYVGGNVVSNGNFQMGLTGWVSGTGQPLGQPWFEVFPKGFSDGYFLQAFANQGQAGEGSIRTAFDIEPGQDYVIRAATCNAGEYIKVDLRKKGETTDVNKATLTSKSYWATQQATFNSGEYDEAVLSFRWLAGTAQLSDIELCRLFTTKEEALADGATKTAEHAEALKTYQAQMEKKTTDSLLTVAKAIVHMNFDGRDQLQAAIQSADKDQLQEALDNFLVMTPSEVQPKSADFSDTKGWTTKSGTYTNGDQRTATKQDKPCWNAWWSGLSASEGTKKTMAVEQTVSDLPEGLYELECKALTEHYCLSDQHGFLKTASEEAATPLLTRDYLDIPNTPSAWQTLTSTPVYVAEGGSLTLGFTGSKQGATDFAWRTYGSNATDGSNKGDQREGWWCATDFRLLFHRIYKMELPYEWGTICLPYEYRTPEGMKLYRVAGLLNDSVHLCIEEVTQAEAGLPYIYRTTTQQATFYTFGDSIKIPVRTDQNNLYGFFRTYTKSPADSYLLNDKGQWIRSAERQPLSHYSAIIRKAEGMPILDSWDGETMPIVGADDELRTLGITTAKKAKGDSRYYTIGGRRTQQSARGMVIQQDRKQAKKLIK